LTVTPDDATADPRHIIAELQRKLDACATDLAQRTAERDEALAQQTASAEVLQVINSSPGDLAPVFDAMLDRALRLCGAAFGALFTYDGECFPCMGTVGFPPALLEFYREPLRPGPGSAMGQLVRGQSVSQVTDIRTDALRSPTRRALADLGGARTMIWVALRKEQALLGCIAIYRQEVRPFSEKEIAVLQNFAAQAVIAIENARLLGELRDRTSDLEGSLEYQTATSDVLQVISRSTFEVQPVLDRLVKTAASLCGADLGHIAIREGLAFRPVATFAMSPKLDAVVRKQSFTLDRSTVTGRTALEQRITHIVDMAADPEFAGRETVRVGRLRTALGVPLMRDGEPIGVIGLNRLRVEPFTERQIELVRTFADQAVIAMENARLLTETREALEQQTATAEVLQVINSSPGDLAPVFDVILEKAHSLCGIAYGGLALYDGEYFRVVARRGYPEQMAEVLCRPFRGAAINQRLVRGERYVHTPDLQAVAPELLGPVARAASDVGFRTSLMVPLRKENTLLGHISASRQEVRPFSEKEIALLENFAAQAVIAMENARLLTETREALEQQTATAEVLQVINSSPGDLAPVFDAMLERAMRLCEVDIGTMWTYDGEMMHAAAIRGAPPQLTEFLKQGPHRPAMPQQHLLRGGRVVQIADLWTTEAYRLGDPIPRATADLGGVRTVLGVPLRKDDAVLGHFAIYRCEVRPFTDKQISLLENFAAQAVIAMENARLLNEIRQRQAELRVTFDNMVDGVAMFDGELRLAAWNRNYQDLLHLPADFLAERHGFDEFVRYLTERGEFGETDPETEIDRLRGRLNEHYQFERTRPDGTVIEVRNNPMPDGGVVLIYSDITERKRSEAEIRAARDAAEAAYRDLKAAQASLIQAEKMASLGQLTAGIAHEIKNPLNFVNNFADLSVELLDELKETTAPAIAALGQDKRTEIDEMIAMLTGNLDKIAEHGRRADGIVKGMLEHSRGTSGERRGVDLNGLIEEALNLAYHGGRARDASFNITLERDFAETIAPIELVPQDITRVCLNLFGNGFYAATKRQKEGSDPKFKPTLKVSTRDLGDAVEINIRDNGVGIPPEIKDKLFQPFFTTKPTVRGDGPRPFDQLRHRDPRAWWHDQCRQPDQRVY
jgi:PAS domain S-box-containing protein